MTIENLVQFAESNPMNAAIVEQACTHGSLSIPEVYDAFAKDIHTKYLKGIYTWSFGSGAMNALYTYAYVLSDTCLPAYAWDVFLAFDEGEYLHPGDLPGSDGEARTKALLAGILEKT